MLWYKPTRDRRQSSPSERAEYERSKRAAEIEREQVERRLEFLEAEATLLEDDAEKRKAHVK